MYLRKLQKNWNAFAKIDPLWAILTLNDKKGNKWQIDHFFDTGVHEIESVVQQLSDMGVNILRKKALDFGCGVGRLSQALALHFDEVWGLDIAPEMIALANLYNKQGHKCRFFLNDKNNLKILDDAQFDFIYTNIVLQHMKPKYSKQYIAEFARILKPFGIAVFQLPSERIRSNVWYKKFLRRILMTAFTDFLFRMRLSLMSIARNGPTMDMYSIKKKQVIALLKQHGFRILSVKEDNMDHGYWKSFIYFVQKIE